MSIIKITKIEHQKKKKGRYSVFLNDKFAFGINEADLKLYGLYDGMELDRELYETIIDNLVLKKAKFLALNYLSYKSRTEKEVRDKLISYGEFNDGVICAAIESLKDAGYIDDEKYAEMFARQKADNRLDGSWKIKRMLAKRGIKYEFSGEELGIDEVENAVKLIEKKCRYLDEPDENDKRRIFNYLARKGYSYSIINEAFKRADEEIEIEWD